MLCHLMQNKLSSIDGELEKHRCKGVEMRELNDTTKFTLQVLYGRYNALVGQYKLTVELIYGFKDTLRADL